MFRPSIYYVRTGGRGSSVAQRLCPACPRLGRSSLVLLSPRDASLVPGTNTPAAMALRIVKGSLDRMFDKNLQDLVRGIRNHKDDESKYVAQCIDEVKQELKQDNIAVKANAIAKLNYLQMLGYDIGWAAFNTIEVMSSPKFAHKRTGYLAAAQSFHEGTDVLMLTTNLIRKVGGACSVFSYPIGGCRV
uniref:Clathrin/coatomer adaptor adaptin-like N-terminal domain-containing protein n=1 Tax=Eptatretus burgeri TaxID=7764 RepID=A0A8C4QXJ2_EPTBU